MKQHRKMRKKTIKRSSSWKSTYDYRMEEIEKRLSLLQKNFHSKRDYTIDAHLRLDADMKSLERYAESLRLHKMAGLGLPMSEDGEWIVEPEGDAPGIFARPHMALKSSEERYSKAKWGTTPRSREAPDLPRQRVIPPPKPPVQEHYGDRPGRFSGLRRLPHDQVQPPSLVEPSAPLPVADDYRGGSVEMYMKLKQEHEALVIAHNQLALAAEVKNAWYSRLWRWLKSFFG